MNYLLLTLLVACGSSNLWQQLAQFAPEDQACRALEKNQPEKARSILLDAFGDGMTALHAKMTEEIEAGRSQQLQDSITLESQKAPKAATWLSILASAQAKIFGIDLFDLGFSFITNKTSQGGNSLVALFPILPDADQAHMTGLASAEILLDAIPVEKRTQADLFKKALFLVAHAALVLKKFDINRDGKIDATEAMAIQLADAQNLVELLDSASETLKQDPKSTQVVEQIQTIKSKISDSSGADEQEKLQNFILDSNLPQDSEGT